LKTQEALKAVLGLDGLDADVKEALEGLDLSGMVTKDASDARAAADRRKAEKKLADALEKIETMQEQLDEAQDSGSSEVEKAQRELAKLTKRAETAEAKAQEVAEAMTTQARTIALGKVASQISFADKVSPTIRELAISEAFKSVDTEDLENPDLVAPMVQDFISSNEAIIVKTNAGGTGSQGGTADGATTTKITREVIAAKAAEGDAAWFRENEPALNAAKQNGQI
jgi:hypothetical protein